MIELPEVAEHSYKVPVIVRDEYTVSLEYTSKMHFGHVDVHKWSPSSAWQLGVDFEDLKTLVNSPIYALHTPGDEKHLKFLEKYGFEYLCDFVDADGDEKQLYKA
jgi:hypothetical protein